MALDLFRSKRLWPRSLSGRIFALYSAVLMAFVVTGLAMLGIGLGIGRIGHEARKADMPCEAVLTTPVVPVVAGNPVDGTAPVVVPAATAAIPVANVNSANQTPVLVR